ncbi:MAG: hypothetical protein EOO07_03385 [Chitinophagaceae bacterium]|nr:MAG: hypothetical protein EOO07_03385 [Chitinophagaceae bacterium]
MTAAKDEDYEHANERGNGPRKRMEGGDLTDDIEINDPDTRIHRKHIEDIQREEGIEISPPKK